MNPLPKPTDEDFKAMDELYDMPCRWPNDETIGERVMMWFTKHDESFCRVKDACKELVDEVCHPDKDTLRYNDEIFAALQHIKRADLKQAMADDKNTLRKIIRGKHAG